MVLLWYGRLFQCESIAARFCVSAIGNSSRYLNSERKRNTDTHTHPLPPLAPMVTDTPQSVQVYIISPRMQARTQMRPIPCSFSTLLTNAAHYTDSHSFPAPKCANLYYEVHACTTHMSCSFSASTLTYQSPPLC